MRRKPRDRRPDDAKPDAAAAVGEQGRVIEPNSARQRDRALPAHRSLGRLGSHLGPVEYTLLGLVAVGVAITVAMAIFNPPG